jgi:GMP synthase (glutamine-hydrolysing)
VLGICFGHQMLSQALGGEVQKNPRGREMGTVTLQLITADDPLLPRAASPQLVVNMSHVDSALRLPADAQLLATTEREPHAAARFGECAWGIQFHPEFDDQVMCDYIQDRSRFLRESGVDPEALAASVQDTPDSREVLARFIRLFARG